MTIILVEPNRLHHPSAEYADEPFLQYREDPVFGDYDSYLRACERVHEEMRPGDIMVVDQGYTHGTLSPYLHTFPVPLGVIALVVHTGTHNYRILERHEKGWFTRREIKPVHIGVELREALKGDVVIAGEMSHISPKFNAIDQLVTDIANFAEIRGVQGAIWPLVPQFGKDLTFDQAELERQLYDEAIPIRRVRKYAH